MDSLLVVLLLISCTGNLLVESASILSATVYYYGDTGYKLMYNVQDRFHGVAYGTFVRSQNETGWGVLNISAGYTVETKYDDNVVSRAAGMLEGALTYKEIYDTYRSQSEFWFTDLSDNITSQVKNFYSTQRQWMYSMITKYNTTQWKYTNFIYQQFLGMVEGYKIAAPDNMQLEMFAFDFLSGNGDWLDIRNFISNSISQKFNIGRCSALIKLLPGYENIYAAHSSWYIYSSMLRIYKHYNFKLQDQSAVTEKMSFSSYPGFLSSLDDFYIMDRLATPNALLAWHRVRLANWLADNGKDWAKYIAQYNSGTYNNQYMVLDLKLVNLTNYIKDNALWVVEQIPGYVEYGDQTAILREGYWSSYNVPFYYNISRLSGFTDPESAHDLAPRAKIFRRDQGNVKNMTDMQNIMRYNGYKIGDIYSGGSPMGAICSRGDLISDDPSTLGCIDTKVTDYHMALSNEAYVISGPTQIVNLPEFQWSTANVSAPHYGQPDSFNFPFVLQSPQKDQKRF